MQLLETILNLMSHESTYVYRCDDDEVQPKVLYLLRHAFWIHAH